MNKQYYQSRTGFITQSALIAALYVVLTMIVAPIAFGPIQFRVSEVLCVLPYFLTSAVPGVTIGCFLANLLCGAATLDVVFGSIATLIGAVGSYYLGKKNKWLVLYSADPFQHHYCSMGTALCIWFYRPDPICHADCRDRRDPGYRCTWKYPVSDTGTSL